MPLPENNKLVFLDTETTGLDYDRHEVVELSWAVEDGPTYTIYPSHSVAYANPIALEINKYYERQLDKAPFATHEDVERFLNDVEGATITGANVRFDARMIVKSLGLSDEPWHYRLFDLSAYAAGILGADRPLGMQEIFERLTELGFTLPKPDHTAAGDVIATRAAFRLLSGFQVQQLQL